MNGFLFEYPSHKYEIDLHSQRGNYKHNLRYNKIKLSKREKILLLVISSLILSSFTIHRKLWITLSYYTRFTFFAILNYSLYNELVFFSRYSNRSPPEYLSLCVLVNEAKNKEGANHEN